MKVVKVLGLAVAGVSGRQFMEQQMHEIDLTKANWKGKMDGESTKIVSDLQKNGLAKKEGTDAEAKKKAGEEVKKICTWLDTAKFEIAEEVKDKNECPKDPKDWLKSTEDRNKLEADKKKKCEDSDAQAFADAYKGEYCGGDSSCC